MLPPGNRFGEMSRKFDFYRRYGVEEYYIFNPDPARLELSGFLRREGDLVEVEAMNGHVSPRLGVRFELGSEDLGIIRPDGRPFMTFLEVQQREQQERERADRERDRAEQERHRAEQAERELEQLRAQLRSSGQGGG